MKSFALVLLVAAAGCRMYGTESSISGLEHGILQEAVALVAARDGVRIDAAALEALAGEDDALMPFARALGALADDYDALSASLSASAAEAQKGGGILRSNPLVSWVGSDRYRSLHRTYGSMIAERRVLADRYERLRTDLQIHAVGSVIEAPQPVSRLQVVPRYFIRLEHQAQRTELRDILANMGAEP